MICKEHYVFLKNILKNNGTEATDYDENKDLYNFLSSNRYIKSSVVRGCKGYIITEYGKIAIRTYKNDNFRFWFPSVISIIAIVLSAFAIIVDLI